jgi:oligoendopeptidase F
VWSSRVIPDMLTPSGSTVLADTVGAVGTFSRYARESGYNPRLGQRYRAPLASSSLTGVSATADPALEAAAWDLEPLVGGDGPEGVTGLLEDARERAATFAHRHKGRLAELGPEGLADAMHELAAIHDLAGRAGSYAMLSFTLDTTDPARGALLQKARELGAAIETQLLFFELEWNQLPDDRADELLAGDGLDFCRHYLRTLRRYRPHQLTEPEERVVTELDVTGSSAFRRLFTEQVSALEVTLPGEGDPTSLEEALSRMQHPDREVREQAAVATTEALRPGVRARAYVFNTLLADQATKDRLRDYPHWLASRNLANEASDESVEALIEAVVGRYELARRWYRLKAGLLGVDKLAYWDRMAPVGDTEEHIPYDEARDIVLDCYSRFSPELGETAGAFFGNGHIDGPPRPGKRGGAFCSYTVPSQHPYVMLNYTSRPYDVLTLAHELGHGVHASLARPQGIFQFTTPLTMAETASIFGETIVLERLLERAPDAAERLSLLAGSLDGAVAAVFRQVAMNRFEHAIHTDRREGGELATDRFAEHWLATQADLLGDAVELHDDYGIWWSYIPHFVDVPGYVYAYAYGHLLALSVYRRYEEEGEDFVPSYLELLRAGGSRPPEELGRIVGVELSDPGFWSSGLDLIERQLEAAEQAARDAGRLDG